MFLNLPKPNACHGSPETLDEPAMLRAIDVIAELWRECERRDEDVIGDMLAGRACDLERQVAAAEVRTLRGLAAKLQAIQEFEFDADQLQDILAGLAADVERIAATS